MSLRERNIYDLSYCNFEYFRKRQINESNEQWECGKRIFFQYFLIIFNFLCAFISPFPFCAFHMGF